MVLGIFQNYIELVLWFAKYINLDGVGHWKAFWHVCQNAVLAW